MLALPHHMDVFKGKQAIETSLVGKYKCIKGHMTPITGTTWEMQVRSCSNDFQLM